MAENLPAERKRGGYGMVGDEPWPEEVRELAFELWCYKFKRKMNDVLDYLNDLPNQDLDHLDIDLTAYNADAIITALSARPMKLATLYAWARNKKWADLAEQRHRAIAPALYNQVDQQLELASIEAVATLIEILRSPKAPYQVRQKAADSILDRTGHTAWVRPSDDGKVQGPQRDYTGTVAGKTVEELLQQALGGGEE